MKEVKVQNLVLGSGVPALCVPLMASDEASLEEALPVLAQTPFDLLEWRADHWRGGFMTPDGRIDGAYLAKVTDQIRGALGGKPLLFTFRTSREGGESDPGCEAWRTLLCRAAACGADLVDMELGTAGSEAERLAGLIRAEGAKVVASSHDFQRTPPKEEMIRRLLEMQRCGADITKLAVMPRSDEDVLGVLEVCLRMKHELADRPYIVIAMGENGMITRTGCAFTGSALTFVTALGASAPGQVPAQLMARIRALTGAGMDT